MKIAAILHDKISSSYVDLALTSTASDLDSKFQAALQSLKLDTEGDLVRWMSVPGTPKSTYALRKSTSKYWDRSLQTVESHLAGVYVPATGAMHTQWGM